MTQTTGIRKHHTPSPECQAPGVAFVLGVSAILDNPSAPTEYGTFYKKCADLSGYHLEGRSEVVGPLKEFIENEMLCALMCCCANHPAHGSVNKNLHQMCVKDILDGANGVFKKKGIPATRFLAEPALDDQRLDFSRGRMNPSGTPKEPNAHRDFPDVAILEKPSERILSIDSVQRTVEMKFSNEERDDSLTIQQVNKYLAYGKPVTIMKESAIFKQNTAPGSLGPYIWGCGCTKKDDEKQLEKDANVLDPRAEFEKQRSLFLKALNWLVPGGKIVKGLKGLGGVIGKGLGALVKVGKWAHIPGM